MDAVHEPFVRNTTPIRTVHYRVLLYINGAQRRRSKHRMTFYNNRSLEIAGRKSIETVMRTRRRFWPRTFIGMNGGRLLKRIVFVNLEGPMRR